MRTVAEALNNASKALGEAPSAGGIVAGEALFRGVPIEIIAVFPGSEAGGGLDATLDVCSSSLCEDAVGAFSSGSQLVLMDSWQSHTQTARGRGWPRSQKVQVFLVVLFAPPSAAALLCLPVH